MSTTPSTTVIAVHGESTRWVDPDAAVVDGSIEVVRDGQQQALADASAALDAVLAGVTRLGAVAHTVESRHAALTYSAQSVATREEYANDERTGTYGPTGRVSATVSVEFTVRDLGRLTALHTELGRHPALHTFGVNWTVDKDNRAWQECRIEAVHAALQRARDYAQALGGRVVRVDEVADTGLTAATPRPAMRSMAAAAVGATDAGAPSLTPVPQQVSASVEVRASAEVPALG